MCFCQAADFADRVASGVLTANVAAEVERLWAQHADAVREKSAAESKNRRLAEKVASMEAEKTDLRRQLAEERREANQAIAKAQAARAEAKVARAESSLASQRAKELEARFNALRSRVKCEGAMNALSREGCRHYEVFDHSDENFEREIFKAEDPVVKQSAGALFDRMWSPHGREAVRERSDRAREQVKVIFLCGCVCGYVRFLVSECAVAADDACRGRRGPWRSGRRAARGCGGQSGAALGCR
jgi:chromosome segregation ATPase